MTALHPSATARARFGLVLALLFAAPPAPLQAQPSPDGFQEPAGANGPDLRLDAARPPEANAPAGGSPPASPVRTHRIRLFRMAPGFLSDPVGLDGDDSLPGAPLQPAAPPGDAGDGPGWLQLAVGNDNPYFDFRQPGDPGGFGFYRLNTQVRLFDSPSTSCALGLQAVTPAGLQFAGAQDGPTVFSPAFALFHALDNGFAVQGFVGKHLQVSSTGYVPVPVQRSLQYGLAIQRPLVAAGPDGPGNLYLFVEALGQYHTTPNPALPPATWEVLPGMHWQVSDSVWISSGVLMPVGPSHLPANRWQLTCSFQF